MSNIIQHPSVQAVLQQPIPKRLEFFQNRVIGHRILLQVRDQILAAIRLGAELSLIFLHGPTGAGKTTVVKKSRHDVRKHFKSEAENDPSFIPDMYVKVWPPEVGPFSFRDLYLSFLDGLEEPHLDDRMPTLAVDESSKSVRSRGKSATELRRMVVSSFKRHCLRVLFLDEAQHMEIVASGRSFLAQLNTLKTLADETGVVIVLSGTQDLLQMLQLNGQLARRSVECLFGRYLPHDEADRQEFANIVATFASYVPLAEAPDLLKHVPLAYEGSLGLVGCLKPWLNRAVTRALDRGSRVLSEQDLTATMLTSAARLRIATEIRNYEIQVSQEGTNQAEIRKLLGLGSTSASGDAKASHVPPVKRSRGVGERNPTRDPVGPERSDEQGT